MHENVFILTIYYQAKFLNHKYKFTYTTSLWKMKQMRSVDGSVGLRSNRSLTQLLQLSHEYWCCQTEKNVAVSSYCITLTFKA